MCALDCAVGVGREASNNCTSMANIDSPWDVAALGFAVAVTAGVCPALDALAKRLGSADGRAGGACDRRCAEGGRPDERHGEAVGISIDYSEEQLMTVTKG